MRAHLLNRETLTCFGCSASASEIFNGSKPLECPAEYFEISPEMTAIITTSELLLIVDEDRPTFVLKADMMFNLRDAIDEGVRKIRERAR